MPENECKNNIDFYGGCWSLIVHTKTLSLSSPRFPEICFRAILIIVLINSKIATSSLWPLFYSSYRNSF